MLITFIIFSVVFYSNVFAASFERNLKVGDSGQDVLSLQKILNASLSTEIALSGVGSPGNETAFFGNLTKIAVIKFQNLYAGDILTPSGLSQGTGFVGQATRSKLNKLMEGTSSSMQNSNTEATSAQASIIINPSSVPNNPLVKSLSGVVFAPGDTVTINGFHFATSSVVHLNNIVASSSVTVSSSTIKFPVPKVTGVFYLWVSNGSVDSRVSTPIFIVVNDAQITAIPKDIGTIVDKITAQNKKVENFFN